MSAARRTKTALDEARMLMLGSQISLGFQFQAPFQDGFKSLSPWEAIASFGALVMQVVAVAFLIAPSAWHRLVFKGEATEEFNRLISLMAFVVPFPLLLAFGCDLFIAGTRLQGPGLGLAFAAVATGAGAIAWYGPMLATKSAPRHDATEPTSIETKIEFVLTEARVILPGVQAMLGFPMVILLTRAFSEADGVMRFAHGAALIATTLAMLALVAPAAIHRIAFEGANEEPFYRTASTLVLCGTALLACGFAADIFLAMKQLGVGFAMSMLIAGATLAGLVVVWLLWPLEMARRRTPGVAAEP